jgi:hypothetical protein
MAQLFKTFVEAHERYALARLEFALAHPTKPSPPVVVCPEVSYEGVLRAELPEIEMQLDVALAYAGRIERARRRRRIGDRSFRLYAQALNELDRAARAMRWMLTITESQYDL